MCNPARSSRGFRRRYGNVGERSNISRSYGILLCISFSSSLHTPDSRVLTAMGWAPVLVARTGSSIAALWLRSHFGGFDSPDVVVSLSRRP